MNPDLLAILILAVSHFVGGIAAFGSSLLALPFLLLLYGTGELSRILFVIVLAGMLQSLYLVLQNWKHCDIKTCALLLVGAACGIPIGMALVDVLPERGILLLLGMLTFLGGVMNLLKRGEGSSLPWPLSLLVALISGLIHGAFASGGTILVAYTQRLLPDRDRFRATLALFWTLLNAGFVIALFFRSEADAALLQQTGIACAVVLGVSFSANAVARNMNRVIFQRMISGLLMLSGFIILMQQV